MPSVAYDSLYYTDFILHPCILFLKIIYNYVYLYAYENLVECEDSEEEGEFAQKDNLQIHQVLPLRQIAPDKIENEEFVPKITYEDFSTNENQVSFFFVLFYIIFNAVL